MIIKYFLTTIFLLSSAPLLTMDTTPPGSPVQAAVDDWSFKHSLNPQQIIAFGGSLCLFQKQKIKRTVAPVSLSISNDNDNDPEDEKAKFKEWYSGTESDSDSDYE